MAFGRAYGFDTLSVTTESGFAAGTSASNTVQVIAGAARTGDGGVRITRGSAAGTVSFGIGNSSQPPTQLNSQMWYGIAIRFQTLPSVDTMILRIGSGTGVGGFINVNASGALTCQIQGGTASATVATLTTGVWYWLEILHDVSTTTHSIKARVDLSGSGQTATRTGQTATTSRFNVIGTDIAGGGTYTCDYDDLVWHTSQTTFMANKRKVVVLRPNSDSNNVWSIVGGDGTAQVNSINEVTPDDATSYIFTTTANAVQLAGMTTYTLGSGESFEGLSTYGRVGSTAATGTRTVAANLRSGVTDGTGSTWSALLNGWQNNTVARDDANVPGGTGWSQSQVDGVIVRLLKDATTSEVRVSTVWVYASVLQPTTTTLAAGQPSESNTAQPVDRLKTGAVGQAAGASTAQPITGAKSKTVGQNAEADTALAFTGLKVKAVGQVAETKTALAITAIKSRIVAVGIPAETETAQPITKVKTQAVGIAAETDFSQAAAKAKAQALGIVSESDTPQAIARLKTTALGLATETDTSQADAKAKARAAGQAAETDLAQAVVLVRFTAPGLVTETDSALPLAGAKSRAAGLATETSAALAITPVKSRTIGFASEIDSALGMRLPMQAAHETDEALPITVYKPRREHRGRRGPAARLLSSVRGRR